MPPLSDQDQVFSFLGDPTRHPGVRRIDTHAASVFLLGDRALKIKRAVRLPFLDYSTLALRKAACAKEIEINRPIAPDIYVRVAAITKAADGSLQIGGSGPPIEYAVEMRRFDDSQTFDHLAAKGPVSASQAERLAEAVAASHNVAVPVSSEAWIDCIAGWVDAFTDGFRSSNRFPQPEVDELSGLCHSSLSTLRSLLVQRARDGHVRRCHGDLHLANIVMIDDKPVLFDAIEFDERIATIDILYDLAFPLMDFLYFDQPLAANHLLNRYVSIAPTDQVGGLAALPLFMAIRAAIRAQVLLAKLDRSKDVSSAVLEDAKSYFRLARRLIQPTAPMLVAVGGLSGTGKSALARALAPHLAPPPGAIVLRSDVLRKRMFGVGETEHLPKEAYTPEFSSRVYDQLLRQADRVLAQGFTVVVDAVFARADERAAIDGLSKRVNVTFVGLFLSAELRIRQERIHHRIADASDATAAVAQQQEAYEIGPLTWARIDASGTPAEILADSLSVLNASCT